MIFTYTTGYRPFEGYTLKWGIGKGGFGEVYFGLSDGGKEAALKLIRTHQAVELRGIRQCLNLKHAHLVHLYDLKPDARGDHWLLMEYVAGEPLHQVLARHPEGLPADLVGQWFQELAEAVHHLHDHGIVHRDLKPANIFLENGHIKIGDYGLCRVLTSQHPPTQSVGTVHYMAPEISKGNYNRQIDIYASGIILYEMLTGKVPFDGESAGEILMKHLTNRPDFSRIPARFLPLLERALAKDPARRFTSIADMSRQLTQIHTQEKPSPPPIPHELRSLPASPILAGHTPGSPAPRDPAGFPWKDLGLTLLLSVLFAGLATFLWGVVFRQPDSLVVGKTFFLMTAGAWSVLIPSFFWTGPVEDSVRRRLTQMAFGLGLGVLWLWLDGYSFPWLGMENGPDPLLPAAAGTAARDGFYGALYPDNDALPVAGCYLGYFGLIFLILRWWTLAEVHRPERLNLHDVFTVGFWAFILLFLLPTSAERQIGFVAILGASLVIQASRRWEEPQIQRRKKYRLEQARR